MYLYNRFTEAYSSCILYFFKSKYVHVISFLKYFEYICISNKNTWIATIKFGGQHASKFGIIYNNGSHI